MCIMNKSKNIPEFNNEDEERSFWGEEDSTEYIDWRKAEPAYFSKLKPSTKPFHCDYRNFYQKNFECWLTKKIFLINH